MDNDIRVSDKASEKLSQVLLKYAEEISEKAIGIAKNSGRKTVMNRDIDLASK